jgi:glyoxylase-like metal-dependent hydrolase (beta-lactamase superfamily II)
MTRYTQAFLIGIASVASFVTSAGAQPADACKSLVPAAMGGPIPNDKNSIVLRWLSTSNYELTFRGRVILLDAYFEQGPRSRPTGIVPDQVKKADAIFIGHAHFDHISDVGPIAQRTNAPGDRRTDHDRHRL